MKGPLHLTTAKKEMREVFWKTYLQGLIVKYFAVKTSKMIDVLEFSCMCRVCRDTDTLVRCLQLE